MTPAAKFMIGTAVVVWGTVIYVMVDQPPNITPSDPIRHRDLAYVWRNTEAMQDGITLIKAGANTSALARFIVCAPPNGSGYLIKGRSIFSGSADVLIVDGPEAGCRGVVPLDFVR
jgi:hypothetical protein